MWTSETAFFPGYLFVSLDLDKQAWRAINGTAGVIRLFGTDARPTPVPIGIVEHLIAMTGAAGLLDMTPSLLPGNPVRLIAGPFADNLATVQSMIGADRVRVLLSIMNRRVVIDLPQAECEAPTN
jgi:transcription antitermination factor NusG